MGGILTSSASGEGFLMSLEGEDSFLGLFFGFEGSGTRSLPTVFAGLRLGGILVVALPARFEVVLVLF